MCATTKCNVSVHSIESHFTFQKSLAMRYLLWPAQRLHSASFLDKRWCAFFESRPLSVQSSWIDDDSFAIGFSDFCCANDIAIYITNGDFETLQSHRESNIFEMKTSRTIGSQLSKAFVCRSIEWTPFVWYETYFKLISGKNRSIECIKYAARRLNFKPSSGKKMVPI